MESAGRGRKAIWPIMWSLGMIWRLLLLLSVTATMVVECGLSAVFVGLISKDMVLISVVAEKEP